MNMDAAAFVADSELINALTPHASPVDCSEDRILFMQGDAPSGLFVFLDGDVSLTLKSHGGEEIMRMAAAKDSLLGLPGLIGSAAYSLSAVAKRGARVTFLSKEDFSQLMLTQPAIAVMILRVLAAEVRTARGALTAA